MCFREDKTGTCNVLTAKNNSQKKVKLDHVFVQEDEGALYYINKTPFVSIRAISDIIGNTNQGEEYYDFVHKAVKNSTDLLLKILEK